MLGPDQGCVRLQNLGLKEQQIRVNKSSGFKVRFGLAWSVSLRPGLCSSNFQVRILT